LELVPLEDSKRGAGNHPEVLGAERIEHHTLISTREAVAAEGFAIDREVGIQQERLVGVRVVAEIQRSRDSAAARRSPAYLIDVAGIRMRHGWQYGKGGSEQSQSKDSGEHCSSVLQTRYVLLSHLASFTRAPVATSDEVENLRLESSLQGPCQSAGRG
jgi:hypothetical protein